MVSGRSDSQPVLSLLLTATLLLVQRLKVLGSRNRHVDFISCLGKEGTLPIITIIAFYWVLTRCTFVRSFTCIFPTVCNSHNLHREGRYNYP